MRNLVQAVILLLFGAALVRLAGSDALLLYVRPVARPWVGLAGLALVLLAGWQLLSLLRRPAEADGEDDVDVAGHRHGPTTPVMWLVLAPVIAVLVIAPPALGAFTAGRAPLVHPAGRPPALAVSSRPVPLSMFDFLILSDARPAALRSQPVTLTGFVLAGRAGGFSMARLVITCCAADASTARVDVDLAAIGRAGPVPPRGSWVQVTGSFTGTDPDADRTPRLLASSLVRIGQPANPYDH
jgi:uncharacterized repeat protein (TIGR03943 family)